MNSDTDRIIGDFLEINADMVYQRDWTKLPYFLSKLIYKINNKKLLKRVEVFRNSNIYLTKNNIMELFNYLQNTIEGDINSSIKKVSFNNTIVAVNSFDKYFINGSIMSDNGNFFASIDIEPSEKNMEIRIICFDKYDSVTNSYNYSISKLDDRFTVNKLNTVLKNFIADYIKSILDSYGGGNDKGN